MSKRLLARGERLTVEWVRRILREARSRQRVHEPQWKLKGVRRAAEYSPPTAAIEQTRAEIEEPELIFVDPTFRCTSSVPPMRRRSKLKSFLERLIAAGERLVTGAVQ